MYKFLLSKLEKFLHFHPRGKILEIGCGKANFIRYIFERRNVVFMNYEIYLSDLVYQTIELDYIKEFKVVDFEKGPIPYPFDYFSFVILIDVIEHIENPSNFLLNIFKVLKKNGVVLLTTPNIESFKKYIYGKKWCGYKDVSHCILYNKETLKRILSKYFTKVNIIGFTQIGSYILRHDCFSDYLLAISIK